MKIIVHSINQIELRPENDADSALLRLWNNSKVQAIVEDEPLELHQRIFGLQIEFTPTTFAQTMRLLQCKKFGFECRANEDGSCDVCGIQGIIK